MENSLFDMKTFRLSLSGALLGMAIMGLLSHTEYLEGIGAVLGSVAVFAAKYRHLF